MIASLAAVLMVRGSAPKTLDWQGYRWRVKSGSNLGPGPNRWSSNNVWVDARGFLHLRISKVDGAWQCAELWTTKALSFGTYQCQVEGRLDTLDPSVVFSMFPYGGPDGVREIDIEFARWGNPKSKNASYTVYPQDSAAPKRSHEFNFSLSGSYTTSRLKWAPEGITFWLMGGHVPAGETHNVMDTWLYQPSDAPKAIPQTPMPLNFNLWLFKGKAPADGKPIEIVIHGFSKS